MVLNFAILREDIKTQNWKVLQILIGVNQKKKKLPMNDSKTGGKTMSNWGWGENIYIFLKRINMTEG